MKCMNPSCDKQATKQASLSIHLEIDQRPAENKIDRLNATAQTDVCFCNGCIPKVGIFFNAVEWSKV